MFGKGSIENSLKKLRLDGGQCGLVWIPFITRHGFRPERSKKREKKGEREREREGERDREARKIP